MRQGWRSHGATTWPAPLQRPQPVLLVFYACQPARAFDVRLNDIVLEDREVVFTIERFEQDGEPFPRVRAGNPGRLTVLDRYPPRVLMDDGGVVRDEGDADADVSFFLDVDPPSPEEIRFRVGTADYHLAEAGVDYEPLDAVMTIAPNQTRAEFTVRVLGDTDPEQDEEFLVAACRRRSAAAGSRAPARTAGAARTRRRGWHAVPCTPRRSDSVPDIGPAVAADLLARADSKQSSRRKGRPRPASAPQGAPPRPDRLARREPRPPGDHARRNDGGSVEPWTVDVPAVFVLKREFQVTRTTLERPQKDPSGSLARKKGRRRRRKFRGFGGSVVQRCHPGQAKWKSRLTGAAA